MPVIIFLTTSILSSEAKDKNMNKIIISTIMCQLIKKWWFQVPRGSFFQGVEYYLYHVFCPAKSNPFCTVSSSCYCIFWGVTICKNLISNNDMSEITKQELYDLIQLKTYPSNKQYAISPSDSLFHQPKTWKFPNHHLELEEQVAAFPISPHLCFHSTRSIHLLIFYWHYYIVWNTI